MSHREEILSNIKAALSLGSNPHTGGRGPSGDRVEGKDFQFGLPQGGDTKEAQWALFVDNAQALKMEVQAVANETQLHDHLIWLARQEAWETIGSHAGSLTDPACAALGLPLCRTDQPYEVGQLETCQASLTECDALIAQTGSILVATPSAGGRALSVLPPHHVVLARRDQLLPDLSAAFALLKQRYSPNYPSFITFITGASRTGDIERILVLGAHGPRKLTVLVRD